MYCRSCGKEVPSHSAFCLHCGSKIAIQQAIPLPTKSGRKLRTILSLSTLGLVCIVALIYGLSSNTNQRQSDALTLVSNPSATPLEAAMSIEASTPAAERSVKVQSKIGVSPKSVSGSGSSQLHSTARSELATTAESAARVSSLAPKREEVEETFYITRTGARYHRSTCRYLRYSTYPITRAQSEARGYTPCRVCYP
jgi:hypothetical protein